MRIGVASSDWGKDARTGKKTIPGGSGWARLHMPARAVAAAGHEIRIGNGIAADPLGRLAPLDHDNRLLIVNAELIVLQRWMNDHAPQAIRAAREAGQVVIHDVDDWFWGLDPRNRAYQSTAPSRDRTHNRRHYWQAIKAADAVTVSSEFLAKRIRERAAVRTVLLRNMVDMPAYAREPIRATTAVTVGWVGALGWRSGDLEILDGVLDPFLAKVGGRFVHHGTFPGETETAAGRAGVAPQRAGPTMMGVPPCDYPGIVSGFDVGVVPLRDIDFNQAKSFIKGLEYAAAGIPFVASRTREYEQLGCGLLASTPAEWAAALERLADPGERLAEQARCVKVAAANDWRVRGHEWPDAYAKLLANSG